MPIRIRFSTKDGRHLSLSDVRKAFISLLISRKNRGLFLYRVDNVTDKKLFAPNGKNAALTDLQWLGFSPDESPLNPDVTYAPYVQNERLDIYRRYVDTLLGLGVAYQKVPPKEKGALVGEARPAIYLKATNDEGFVDLLLGKVSPEKHRLADWIIVHPNGVPTGEFATIIDDHLMNVTHVVSEEKALMSAIKCHSLCQHLNWSAPTFIHLPDMKEGIDESSRRLASTLRENGYLSDAVASYLYNLEVRGYEKGHVNNLDEILADFEIKKIHHDKRVFDFALLDKINASFIKQTTDAEYSAFIRPFFAPFINEKRNDDYMLKLANLYKKQIYYGAQLCDYLTPFLADKYEFSPVELSLINAPEARIIIRQVIDAVKEEGFFDCPNDYLNAIQKQTGITGKAFYLPLRLLLTRLSHGAEIDEVFKFLGQEEVLRRLCQDKD